MKRLYTRGRALFVGFIVAAVISVAYGVMPVLDARKDDETREAMLEMARNPIERRYIFPVTRPAFSGTPTIDAQYARIRDKHKEKK